MSEDGESLLLNSRLGLAFSGNITLIRTLEEQVSGGRDPRCSMCGLKVGRIVEELIFKLLE